MKNFSKKCTKKTTKKLQKIIYPKIDTKILKNDKVLTVFLLIKNKKDDKLVRKSITSVVEYLIIIINFC